MSHPDDARPAAAPTPGLTVFEKRVLARIFQHPLSHNLPWREVFELFRAVGTVDHVHNGNVELHLGDDHLTFAPARKKDLAADDVMALRHFLTKAGWTPGEAPAAETASDPALDRVIVIDQAGARIYAMAPQDGIAPEPLRHLSHRVERKQGDANRDETFPADRQFFDDVAAAMAGEGRIVVVGHGAGQSREADHLIARLDADHAPVRARIARSLTADLPHLSATQIVQLARDALEDAGSAAA